MSGEVGGQSSGQLSAPVTQAALWVVGMCDAEEAVSFRLGHGELPEVGLRVRGWAPLRARDVVAQAAPHTIRLVYDVEKAPGTGWPAHETRRDPGLVILPGEVALRHQRLAAYAVVTSERGVLLSRFSTSTNSPGTWGLCGGGVDPGELPEETVHREVWEESGQRIEITGLATITSSHWVGRAPSGRLEDFHAVRLGYDATCQEPTDPVVHDVGGTTEHSEWVPLDRVASLPLVSSWRDVLPALLRR